MPSRPSKPCRFTGCKNLVKKGYCLDHIQYDTSKFRNKRGKSHKWYYDKYWKALRLKKLREYPLCEYCEQKGDLTPANVVDHKKDWKWAATEEEQWRLFSDWCNLASSCESCHNAKSARTNKFAYRNK